ncbi:MAG: MarR family transcriptional regulator [Chloroflexi bacterium]|nr:MarR family transcriptional regulator [Chloroflexota bacterium]
MIDLHFYTMTVEMRVLNMVINKIAREELERRLTAQRTGISGVQFGVLHILKHQQQTISELSRMMVLDPSTLVPMVDNLERKGLLRRQKDPHDRRRVPLALTDAGAALVASIPAVDENDPILLSLQALGRDNAKHLIALIHQFIQHLPDGSEIACELAARVRMHVREQLNASPTSDS